jgi:hypothetical protein
MSSIEEIVEALTNEYMAKLVKRLRSIFTSYMHATVNLYGQRYLVKPILELNIREFEWGVEAYVRVYFDEPDVAKIREAVRKQLEDNRLRIKAYADIVKMRIKGSSGEIYALLSGVRSSPPEGNREAGVPGEEVRGQEGGSTPEDSQ